MNQDQMIREMNKQNKETIDGEVEIREKQKELSTESKQLNIIIQQLNDVIKIMALYVNRQNKKQENSNG